jgi:hypothetical protein
MYAHHERKRWSVLGFAIFILAVLESRPVNGANWSAEITSGLLVTRAAIGIGPPDCMHAGFAEYRRHRPIRLAKPALDPYSMRVWPAVQKLPAPAATLRWQKVKAHPDQTGSLQTERIAANGMQPRPQANPLADSSFSGQRLASTLPLNIA